MQEIQERLERGQYEVDADAVAAAIIARLRGGQSEPSDRRFAR